MPTIRSSWSTTRNSTSSRIRRSGPRSKLNDHRGVIVGLARVAANGLNGVPTLYTTYSRAIEYIPTTRFTISYVLLQPKSDAAIADIKQRVAKLGYVALTKEEFNRRIADYYTTRPASAPTSC